MKTSAEYKLYDTIIIGGGQSGLSVAYFLRRKKRNYIILDDRKKPGGAWQETWDSLTLFSPSTYSSLSGWQMPKGNQEYPSKNEFLQYLQEYETRYNFPIERNVSVKKVIKDNDAFKLETNNGIYKAKTLVSATGTARNPYIPHYPGYEKFEGKKMHSVAYKNTDGLLGKKVLVVGGGNSGAQLLAEISKVANTTWVTQKEPTFLPEEIDGRYLFNQATARYLNKEDNNFNKTASLGDIVQVETVREALKRDVYQYHLPFERFYKKGVIWENGTKEPFDVVIWCTGFNASLDHLSSLTISENNKIDTKGTRSIKEPNLWLVGYGNWTGYASATIYGVGKTARETVAEIEDTLVNM